jgi:hypothetical protein
MSAQPSNETNGSDNKPLNITLPEMSNDCPSELIPSYMQILKGMSDKITNGIAYDLAASEACKEWDKVIESNTKEHIFQKENVSTFKDIIPGFERVMETLAPLTLPKDYTPAGIASEEKKEEICECKTPTPDKGKDELIVCGSCNTKTIFAPLKCHDNEICDCPPLGPNIVRTSMAHYDKKGRAICPKCKKIEKPLFMTGTDPAFTLRLPKGIFTKAIPVLTTAKSILKTRNNEFSSPYDLSKEEKRELFQRRVADLSNGKQVDSHMEIKEYLPYDDEASDYHQVSEYTVISNFITQMSKAFVNLQYDFICDLVKYAHETSYPNKQYVGISGVSFEDIKALSKNELRLYLSPKLIYDLFTGMLVQVRTESVVSDVLKDKFKITYGWLLSNVSDQILNRPDNLMYEQIHKNDAPKISIYSTKKECIKEALFETLKLSTGTMWMVKLLLKSDVVFTAEDFNGCKLNTSVQQLLEKHVGGRINALPSTVKVDPINEALHQFKEEEEEKQPSSQDSQKNAHIDPFQQILGAFFGGGNGEKIKESLDKFKETLDKCKDMFKEFPKECQKEPEQPTISIQEDIVCMYVNGAKIEIEVEEQCSLQITKKNGKLSIKYGKKE